MPSSALSVWRPLPFGGSHVMRLPASSPARVPLPVIPFDPSKYHEHRVGAWLPADRRIVSQWVNQFMERARAAPKPLDSTLEDLRELVDGDPVLKPLAQCMFLEIPDMEPYRSDPTGLRPQVESFDDMLLAINEILSGAPVWTDVGNRIGLIGFPINAVLAWPMATASGSAFFLYYPEVNECLGRVLTRWGTYLKSRDSTAVLAPPLGWLGAHALSAMTAKGNENGWLPASDLTFTQLFKCPDPLDATTLGFESWDAFFTRELNVGARRVAAPDDDSVVCHACEAAALGPPVRGVQLSDNFYGKNQSYSLEDMLDGDPRAAEFVGGTVYQGFLNALSYHRWHAPVAGTVVGAYTVPGTYYAENAFKGFAGPGSGSRPGSGLGSGKRRPRPSPDPTGPNGSQAFIASVAARAIVLIRARNPAIGLVGFVGIGMAEVSSCEILVREGDPVEKGEQIGMFHFGGSTHTLLFGPRVHLDFDPGTVPSGPLGGGASGSAAATNNAPVSSVLAVARPMSEKEQEGGAGRNDGLKYPYRGAERVKRYDGPAFGRRGQLGGPNGRDT